jgi:acyl-CoA synthetase (NDP forming)
MEFTNYTSSHYGIHFCKTISYGNALTLDSTDFLDYLAHDEETKIIAMYLEGVKDARRLLQLTTEITRSKPIIIYKGGLTESGARAASSHTGSLAGGEKIWTAFFRQSGAVPVESLEEMADATMAFHHLGDTPGRRTTMIGIGGGISVAAADSCARAGLELPALSPGLIKKLRKIIPPAGTIISNPIDAAIAFGDLKIMGELLELMATSGEIDNFIISMPLDWLYDMGAGGAYVKTVATYFAQEGRKHTHGKPIVAVWRSFHPDAEIKEWVAVLKRILIGAGIPVYDGLPPAVTALAKLAAYHEFRKDNP